MTIKSDQVRIRIRIDLAHWIRIRNEIKRYNTDCRIGTLFKKWPQKDQVGSGPDQQFVCTDRRMQVQKKYLRHFLLSVYAHLRVIWPWQKAALISLLLSGVVPTCGSVPTCRRQCPTCGWQCPPVDDSTPRVDDDAHLVNDSAPRVDDSSHLWMTVPTCGWECPPLMTVPTCTCGWQCPPVDDSAHLWMTVSHLWWQCPPADDSAHLWIRMPTWWWQCPPVDDSAHLWMTVPICGWQCPPKDDSAHLWMTVPHVGRSIGAVQVLVSLLIVQVLLSSPAHLNHRPGTKDILQYRYIKGQPWAF